MFMVKKIILMFTIALLGLGVVTFLGFFNRFAWIFDLMTHWRWLYMWMAGLLTIFFTVMHQQKRVMLAFLLFLINGFLVLHSTWSGSYVVQADSKDSHQFDMVLININKHAKDHQQIGEYLDSIRPDIIGLVEFTQKAEIELVDILTEYPYTSVSYPRADYDTGVALYSRIPIKASSKELYGGDRISLVNQMSFTEGEEFSLLITHPRSPTDADDWQFRNKQLLAIAQAWNNPDSPLIVMGDLNITPWAYPFNVLLSETDLVDSRRGFGMQASWHSHWTWWGIPIDHILVSKDFNVNQREIGPDVASDHRPVYIQLEL